MHTFSRTILRDAFARVNFGFKFLTPGSRSLCVYEMLNSRGLMHDSTSLHPPQPNYCYVGFDPTANSLHIGNLLQIIVLQHLANAGFKPIALIGGATGQIGDPSGKSTERQLLSVDVVKSNADRLSQVLRDTFEGPLTICNNVEWYREMSMLEFLRDVGKEFRMNTMLERESVKSRVSNADLGMSFTEFSYQILQSHDFLTLHEKFGCDLQFGGSDQWGNIISGIDYIKKRTKRQVYGFTIPLLTDEHGNKIGKTSEGNDKLWLSKDKTSVFEFYQYFVNISDSEVEKLLKAFTFLSLDEIAEICEQHKKNPHLRIAQVSLARAVTKYIHKVKGLLQAELYNNLFFSDRALNSYRVTEFQTAFAETDLLVTVPKNEILNTNIVKTAARLNIFPSQAQVKKYIIGGGLSINGKKIDDTEFVFRDEDICTNDFKEKYMIFRLGKKKFKLVFIQEPR